jgi:hypothetical protein
MARASMGGQRRVGLPDVVSAGHEPEYLDASEAKLPGPNTRSAEEWSRVLFEEAPRPIPWCLAAGWRAVLGLRLGPRRSPDHVLGWRITSNEPDMIRLGLQSPLMTAELVLRSSVTTVVVTTNLDYVRPIARLLWAVVGPIHRRVLPYLLKRAVSSLPGATS